MDAEIQKFYPLNAANEAQVKSTQKPLAANRKTGNDNTFETGELLKILIDARNEWLDAVDSFEHAYEDELVDYYTYKMKACEARYTYFIKLAKDRGLTSMNANIRGVV